MFLSIFSYECMQEISIGKDIVAETECTLKILYERSVLYMKLLPMIKK